MTDLKPKRSARRAGRLLQTKPAFYREVDLVYRLLPFSSSTLWRMVKRGMFPEPVKLSPNVTAWPARNVDLWVREREEAAK